jgi:hypothetical protein
MDKFDYEFYLNTYPDLNHLNYIDAFLHYQNYGIKEGRICYKRINTTTNISIILHLFNTNLFDEMLCYINNVKDIFSNVNILITINEHSDFERHILKSLPNAIVIKNENRGVDVYPFFICIKYLRDNNIKTDYILKLHTKESSNDIEGLENWRKEIITPIVDYNNLLVLQHYFKHMNNIGYVSAQKCVLPKNYDLDFEANIKGINELCDMFPHLEKEWTDFNGGNIFWINNECLNEYLTNELIEYLSNKFVVGKPPCNLTNKTIYVEYLCERMFTGIFCFKKKNIFVSDYIFTNRGIDLDHSYFYQPKIFSISIPEKLTFN